MAVLYIVGNGFDLHHEMKTSYKNFRDYLKVHHKDVFELVEEYFTTYDDDDFWSQFEESLADFDAETLAEDAAQFLVSYGAEEWRDSNHHDYAFEIEQVVEGLSVKLLAAFTEWVKQIAVPERRSLTVSLARIDPDARFINFNYTPTLQRLYGVREARVWHVHGSASSSEPLVLGHGWKPKPNETWFARVDSEDTDTRVMEGARILDKYFEASFKDTGSIIAHNAGRFAELAEVGEVRILGHSLAEVDRPYLAKIAATIQPNAKWRVSCRSSPEELQAKFAKFAPLARAVFLPLSEV